MEILEQLVGAAHDEAARRSRETPLAELEEELGRRAQGRPFAEAISRPGMSVIAEFKRRSPSSKEEFRPGADVARTVGEYERAGAAAISVLTQEKDFGGALGDLVTAHGATRLPILRKDFVVTHYQLVEAAVAGADAVLLIVAAVEADELKALMAEARSLDLDCLVEVHDEHELDVALEAGADVIGINNRNLHTLEVSLETTHGLVADIPAGKSVVSESGISTREGVAELASIGVDAVLVGEALMRAADPAALIADLLPADEIF